MYWYENGDGGHNKWAIAAGIVAVIVLWMLFSGDSGPVLSSWRGQPAAAAAEPAGLTGQAIAVSGQPTGRGFAGAPADTDIPWGDPLGGTSRTVMTQGYGVGTHAPAEIWGAIDLAIDENGDGVADPGPSYGAPVYATHAGYVKLTAESYPAGNHIWVIGNRYKTGYAHLQSFAVEDGAYVERGTLIGHVGSSGMSSGPHLDYQVWEDGVNVLPLNFNVFQ